MGDGRCIYLTDDNLCDIYDIRPDICNVDRMYEIHFKYIMTREEYDCYNTKACKILQMDV